MKLVEQYRENAKQCRELARNMPLAEQREQLLNMASQWEAMAEDRRAAVEPHDRDEGGSIH